MAAGLERLSEPNLADTRRKCNETAQIKLSVRSTILRLLFSLLAAYMACGGAAAQNVVTDLERHCGANQRRERQGTAMGMNCAADYTPHAEPAAAIRVRSLPFTPRHNRLRRLPCQFLTHVPAYLDRATCW